ncbi:MAG: hypothetical protein IPM06_18845 [Rhizobiales bacterium]|nr:hypothetical protein [Hyphomicrobiales bacterium]
MADVETLSAMEHGFEHQDADMAPLETPAEQTEEQQTDDATQEVQTEEPAATEPPDPIKEFEASINQRFSDHNEQVFGKVGRMLEKRDAKLKDDIKKELLASIQSQAPELSDDDLKEAMADFDELGVSEIGGAVGKALKKVMSRRTATPSEPAQPAFDAESLKSDFDARVTERVEQVRREMAIERLTELREDWTEVRNSAGFKQWFVIQPADYQQRINSSWKPGDVISAINAYEAHVKKATSKKQDNTKRLDAAITPTKSGGVALPTMSVLDAMEYGLKNPN